MVVAACLWMWSHPEIRGNLGCPFSLRPLVRVWKLFFEQVSLKLYDG